MRKVTIVVMALLMIGTIAVAGNNVVASKFDAKLYGFVRFETIYDTKQIAKGDWQLFVPSGAEDDAVFTMNARHTRMGIDFMAPDPKPGMALKGKVEWDFAGGFPNSGTAARQPLIRLRHAWVELNTEKWEARFGQDWALISGPFPGTTNFVVGAGKGNLWMRYPQIKFTYKMKPFKFAASINRPMAGNEKYDDYKGGDFDPVFDGEITGMPFLMGRAWFTQGPVTFSVSGHYGQEDITDLDSTKTGISGDVAELHEGIVTYSINGDVIVKAKPLTFTARFFYGENLNQFFGGVFQGYVASSTDVENVKSMGGWASVKYMVNDKVGVTVGGGMDDPDDEFLSANSRDKNTWIFGNCGYMMTKDLSFILGADMLTTEYVGIDDGDNLRFMFNAIYKF